MNIFTAYIAETLTGLLTIVAAFFYLDEDIIQRLREVRSV